MAIPTQPTATLISTEGWKMFGKTSPTTTDITRATDYGIEKVKKDLKNEGLEWDFLRTVTYLPTVAYNPKIQCPTDHAKYLEATILDGTVRGTAQAGASSTITLASSDTASSTDMQGKMLCITGGTGVNQARWVISYNSSTKVATVNEAWDTTPDSTSTYLVVTSRTPLGKGTTYDLAEACSHTPGKPSAIYHEADSAEGDLILNRPPDQIYVIEYRYYADLLKVDLTSTLYSRILRLLQWTFIQGVFVWALQDDSRKKIEEQIYRDMLRKDAMTHLYPNQDPGNTTRLDWN